MPFVQFLIMVDCGLIVACLVVLGLLVLVQRHSWRRVQSGNREGHEPAGRHEQGERRRRHRGERNRVRGIARTVDLRQAGGVSVAELREREQADDLRYYPKGEV